MNREIKFRGKAVVTGKWVYGSLLHNTQTDEYSIVQFEEMKQSPVGFGSVEYDVDPETVGEFTGLHDKNGTPIYEGDIIEGAFTREMVSWSADDAAFLMGVDRDKGFIYTGGEVIGNIFDDSGLLGKEASE